MEYMPVGVTIVDRDLSIRFWNPAFCQVQGFPDGVMYPGVTMADVFRFIALRGDYGPGDIEELVAARVELCMKFTPHSFMRTMANGLKLNIIGRPIYGADGGINGFVTIYHDVTAEKRHEEELEAKNEELLKANEQAHAASLAKGHFLSNMSHEIRTPLNCVIGMAYLALKTDLDPRQRDYLEKIRFAGEHLLGLIDNILDISKIEAGKMDVQNVEFCLDYVMETLTTVVAPQAASRNLKLVFDLDPALPKLLVGDPLRLGQVLINYTNNAIKFSQEGTVEIRVRKEVASPSTCLLRFEVKDQGVGLSSAEMAKLFVSFQQADTSTTREYGGTGLGLAICKELAQLMGGDVGVNSQPGVGSTFWFTAELRTPPNAAPALIDQLSFAASELLERGPARHARELEAVRILLAEDNTFNQQIAQEILEEEGARVCVASNGVEALELLRHSEFDCVLMDLQMPQMDGLEATRRIRASPHLARLPVLAMTATATTEARMRCIDAGMNDFISKPVQPALMCQIIANWLPQRALQTAPRKDESHAPSVDPAFGGDPAVIDLSVLAALFGNDPHSVRKFAIKFLQSARDGVGEMEAALVRGEVELLRQLGHRIKSAARTVGAFGMADLCHELELLPREEASVELASARRIVIQLRKLLEKVALEALHGSNCAVGDGG